MKYLKKILAISTIASILIASSISTNAAWINGATALASGLTTGQTITITKLTAFPDGDEIASATITKLDWSAAWTTTLTAPVGASWTEDNSVLTIATTDLNDNTSYFITFTTVSGDVGSTTLRVWTPTNDTLTVSASVEPMLKFAMEANTQNLGMLTTTATGVTTWIEVGTNAIGGIIVSAQTTNWWLKSTSALHTINLTGNDAIYSAENYEFSTALGTADSASGAIITWATTTPMNTVNQTIPVYSTNKPQNFDTIGGYDVDFTVSAKIAASTPAASDYGDVIIFTATATF